MVTAVQESDVMQQLKDATWELHERAENHTFQKALVNGTLPLSGYVAFLSQMWLVHQGLERHLRRLQAISPYSGVLRDYHFREDHLRADLESFEQSTEDIEPLPATSELLRTIEDAVTHNEVSTIGFHYVLEGSTNGSKYISRSVRKAYNLNGAGTSYLDPHGDLQRERWSGFKADMGQVAWDAGQVDAMVRAALDMFRGITDISEGLAATNR